MNFDFIKELIKRLDKDGAFYISLLLVVLLTGYYGNVYGDKNGINRNILIELKTLNNNIIMLRAENLDHLTEDAAKQVVSWELILQYRKIKDEIDMYLNENHIENQSRRDVIYNSLSASIVNQDKRLNNILSRYYFNDKPLSYYVSNDPNKVLSETISVIFSNKYTRDINHAQMRKDVFNKLEQLYTKTIEDAKVKIRTNKRAV